MAESNKFPSKRTYKQEPMLATSAMIMQAKLLRLAGPAVSRIPQIMQGFGKNKTPEQEATSNAAAISAFAEIFSQTDPEELAGLLKELCEVAMIKRGNGEYGPVDFDGDMTGHTGDIMPLVIWVIREQFADFFSGLLGLTALAK